MSHRKRQRRQRSDTHSNQYDLQAASSPTRPDHSLFIVAHEADIIRGPQAARLADSLEVGTNVDGHGGSRIGQGLIKWESKVGGSSSSGRRDAEGGGDMWVDRYVYIFERMDELEYTPSAYIRCLRSAAMVRPLTNSRILPPHQPNPPHRLAFECIWETCSSLTPRP
jgi:hypothetical protein